MKLPDQAIEDFKRLYREQLGIVLDDSAARAEAERLMSLAIVLTEPIDSDKDEAFLEELRWSGRRKRSKI